MTRCASRSSSSRWRCFSSTILAGFIGSRQSLPQHRADAGLDHLVGRLRLCVGVRRRPVAADQSVAHDVRVGRAALPKGRWPESLARPALSRAARRLAGGAAAARLFLDRAGLSESRGAAASRVVRGRLFHPHLRRHGAVRPRHLAAARRGLHRRVRAPSRASPRPKRAPARHASCCCGRSAPGCSTAPLSPLR